MSEQTQTGNTESWGTSSWGAGDDTAAIPAQRDAAAGGDVGSQNSQNSHASLPHETGGERPTSYGTFFEHPPYATEEAPMTVDVPDTAPRPMPTPQPTQAAPQPQPVAPAPSPAPGVANETVTCPECGATQYVNLNRRDSTDFCRRCDFPLFWVPSRVTRDHNPATSGESLRRLPGTGGATRLASIACPHCAERNPATAETCARCGRSMRLESPPPPPQPVYVPPPAPEPEPEPAQGVPWWVWTLIGTVGVVLAFVVLYLVDIITF